MTVRTRAELNGDADFNLPDNAGGLISPEDVRDRIKDLADSALLPEDIGTSVQSYDPDLAATDAAQTWTGAQQFGQVTGTVTAMPALDLNCALGNDFTKTIAGASTFTVSNVPSGKAFDLRLILTYTSGTITWFSGIEWLNDATPALAGGKVYEIIFTTINGGTTWRAVAGEYDD